MKNTVFIVLIFCFGLLFISSCNKDHCDPVPQSITGTEASNINGEQSVLYTCPMHPEIQSNNPGKCPKCGMDLIVAEMNHFQMSHNNCYCH